jgi:hypothetical protein
VLCNINLFVLWAKAQMSVGVLHPDLKVGAIDCSNYHTLNLCYSPVEILKIMI